MLYWIYNLPGFVVGGLFVTLFVGVCWLGIILFGSSSKAAESRWTA
jgi:hypothetical protein